MHLGARCPSERTGTLSLATLNRAAPGDDRPPAPEKAAPSGAGLKDLILTSLDDDKAEDLVTIDLTGKSSVADYMVIASGRSHRHVGAIADRLARNLKDAGLGTVQVEGLPHCDWVLIDVGDVIVHLFRPEVREFYNLEKIWGVEAARTAS